MKDNDLLRMNDLQLLALAVVDNLLLLKNSAALHGSGRLHAEVEKNVKLCAAILSPRILSARQRCPEEKRKLQKQVTEFRDLVMKPLAGFEDPQD